MLRQSLDHLFVRSSVDAAHSQVFWRPRNQSEDHLHQEKCPIKFVLLFSVGGLGSSDCVDDLSDGPGHLHKSMRAYTGAPQ